MLTISLQRSSARVVTNGCPQPRRSRFFASTEFCVRSPNLLEAASWLWGTPALCCVPPFWREPSRYYCSSWPCVREELNPLRLSYFSHISFKQRYTCLFCAASSP